MMKNAVETATNFLKTNYGCKSKPYKGLFLLNAHKV